MSEIHPSRSLDKIIVRLPDGMRERLSAAAKSHGISMNALVVDMLDRSLRNGSEWALSLLQAEMRAAVARIAEHESAVAESRAYLEQLYKEAAIVENDLRDAGVDPETVTRAAAVGKLANSTRAYRPTKAD